MKPSKEALVGVLAALQERRGLDLVAWAEEQKGKVAWFNERANRLPGIMAGEEPDPAGLPFSRVCLTVKPIGTQWNASVLAAKLRAGTPSIWLMEQGVQEGRLLLELVPLDENELRLIIDRLACLVSAEGP